MLVVAAQVLRAYACLGLVLPFGDLRTGPEMYIADLVRHGASVIMGV